MEDLTMARFRSSGTRWVAALTVAGIAAIGLTGCASSKAASEGGGSSSKVSIVAYSVPKPAYDALSSAFTATDKGKGVSFDASYGASGDQSRAVANGQKADYVAFSLAPDLTKLVPDFVNDGWKSGPTKGLVSDSVVVIAVRKGNPKGIKGWDDLIKPGISIVTPDPGSSGSAKWNLLAAYAHGLANGGQTGGTDYLKKFAANIKSKPESGSKATQTFLSGTGDVLISYENEAIGARQKGQNLDYVVPDDTLLIENPAAVTKNAPQAARDFLAFVESADGQKIFASKGFRPVLAGVSVGTVQGATDPANPFPAVKKLTTIADLGGWSEANKKFFDKTDGIITKILNGNG
jgi:sulfate/thiosulfate-binding protein